MRSFHFLGGMLLLITMSATAEPGEVNHTNRQITSRIIPVRPRRVHEIPWQHVKSAGPDIQLGQLLGLPIDQVVGHTGFTASDYFHEGIVEKRLTENIATRPANALHVVMLSEKGLAPILCDLITGDFFRSADRKPQGRLLVIADLQTLRKGRSSNLYLQPPDAVIVVEEPSELVDAFVGIMSKAAAEGLDTEVLMKEGGESAIDATALTLLNIRFANLRKKLRIHLDTGFLPRDPAAENWQMGASQFLATWKDLGPYFEGVGTEVSYHVPPKFEWRGVPSVVRFESLFPTGPERTREILGLPSVLELNAGTLHPHALVGRWQTDEIFATAQILDSQMDVYVQVGLGGIENVKMWGFSVEVEIPKIGLRRKINPSNWEKHAITLDGDIYKHAIDLSNLDIGQTDVIEVKVTIDLSRSRRSSSKIAYEFEVLTTSSHQQEYRSHMAYIWKRALSRASKTEYRRLINGQDSPLAMPLATWDKPLVFFKDRSSATRGLGELSQQLDQELKKLPAQTGQCEISFIPRFE